MNNQYNLGVVSVSFRKHTPTEILEAMREAGLTHIEWGSDIHVPYNDIENVKAIAELQKAYGITCSSYGTYFYLGRDPIDQLPGYIDAAKILGTNILRLWCGNKAPDKMTEPEKEEFIDTCRKAAAIAEENGAILCMECHPHSYTERIEDALELMDAVNSESFRMYWQRWSAVSEEVNLEYAEKIAPYTYHIHAHFTNGDQPVSIHEGIKEWKDYLSKFTTPRTLLLEFMPDRLITSLKREADALRIVTAE